MHVDLARRRHISLLPSPFAPPFQSARTSEEEESPPRRNWHPFDMQIYALAQRWREGGQIRSSAHIAFPYGVARCQEVIRFFVA